ncbi:helix-turn-helix transcriptional regulator [Verrucomicrobiota bacterium sgz303538]
MKKDTERDMHGRRPFCRIAKIHEALRAGDWPNCAKLAKSLEFHRKTILRDIEFMRESMGLPIAFDYAHKGYHYTRDVPDLPSMQINEDELKALCQARQFVEANRGTKSETHLRRALEKLTRGLSESVRLRLDEVASVVSFRSIGAGFEATLDSTLFHSLRDAILEWHEVTFSYTKIGATSPEKRRVRPLHITCVDSVWYLLAHDHARRDIRTFALPRIASLELTGHKFTEPYPFRVEDRLMNSIGIYSGDKPEQVRLRLTNVAARLMTERRWHPSQQITQGATDTTELTMTVAITPELERMVLSWGPDVHVLEPESLREIIRTRARALAELYS